MIVEQDGWYGILNDYPPNNTFKEWRYLVAGTKCDDALVFPKTALPMPSFNEKMERLVEIVTVVETEILQGWEIVNLTREEREARKRPDGNSFQLEMIGDPNLLLIYQKILENPQAHMWLNEVRAAIAAYTIGGFSLAINALAQSIPLSKEEIQTVNNALYRYDLELITWQP